VITEDVLVEISASLYSLDSEPDLDGSFDDDSKVILWYSLNVGAMMCCATRSKSKVWQTAVYLGRYLDGVAASRCLLWCTEA